MKKCAQEALNAYLTVLGMISGMGIKGFLLPSFYTTLISTLPLTA
jgi:hypothetical protein